MPDTLLFSADIVGDGLCVINGSVLRGCGLQVMAAKVVLFSYYVVAIPVSVLLGFYTDMGVLGLAWGITLGTFVHSGEYVHSAYVEMFAESLSTQGYTLSW